jgi:hypothetical protein
MERSTTTLYFILALGTLCLMQAAALMFSLYWIYPNLDIPMHFLGGAVAALGYQSKFFMGKYAPRFSFRLMPTIVFVVAIGLLWEGYELVVGPVLSGHLTDTLIDLLMDTLGGIIGFSIGTYGRLT